MGTAISFISTWCLLTFAHVASGTALTAEVGLNLKFAKSGNSVDLSQGEKKTIDVTEPIWVSSPGKVPLLLIPFGDRSHIQLNPATSEETRCDMNLPENRVMFDSEMSNMILDVFELQKQISRRDVKAAETTLEKLRSKYPRVSALDFLEASFNILKGDRDKAAQNLKTGLTKHPNYEDGKALLKALKGRGADQ